ncbi:hypothetical protein F3Y22_tig00111671pilonHSYRG00035 [Hibiscus syriacus]|uniref:FAF domain-containing protein n=1 Tax=Hibiscus syriacus TaxID=106335 RepID=A0A6A2XYD6_HIBSY|nr:protein FANTASTIC FOUR 1-like [Hibiscus syriacus]KAE8675360.1 hypothetical protein F3Y22_tig00111671pilonHSYRG00035 [Hibiscus syriacus]
MPYCYLYYYAQFMLNKYYFGKKSVHSFLGLSNKASPHSKCGLGLVFSNEYNPNVVESSSLPLLNTKPMSSLSKKDPGVIRFMDDMGGEVDGLTSCTESLGFESCSEKRVNDEDEYEFCKEEIRGRWRNKKRVEEKRSDDKRDKKFPPPLSSLNQNGRPCFYLKPVRANGRLELTEVKIHRPEILLAVRENGRLRLHLVRSDICCKFNEDEEREHEEVHDLHEEEEKGDVCIKFNEDEEIEQEVHDLHEEEEEEGMKLQELWNYRVNGEGSSRCHEMVHYHRHHGINGHHSMHVWRQPCVSIR